MNHYNGSPKTGTLLSTNSFNFLPLYYELKNHLTDKQVRCFVLKETHIV